MTQQVPFRVWLVSVAVVGATLRDEPAFAQSAAAHAARPSAAVAVGRVDKQRLVGLALGGAGVVALGVATVTGILFLNEKGTIDEACDAWYRCSYRGKEAAAAAETLGWVNTVAFVGGVGALAAGAALFFTSKDAEPRTSPTAIRVGPTRDGSGMAVRLVGRY